MKTTLYALKAVLLAAILDLNDMGRCYQKKKSLDGCKAPEKK